MHGFIVSYMCNKYISYYYISYYLPVIHATCPSFMTAAVASGGMKGSSLLAAVRPHSAGCHR